MTEKQWELLDPQALEWIKTRSLTMASSINSTTRADLQRVLGASFERGDSIQQITQNISGYFDGSQYRAERVARTETIAASNEGALHRYEKEGVEKSEFYPNPDACEVCLPLAGEYPTKEVHNKIPVHPNCRCIWLPVISSTTTPTPQPKPIEGGKEGAEWKESLSPEEQDILQRWQDENAYQGIREAQRQGLITDEVQLMERALNKDGSFEGTTFRGLHGLKSADAKAILKSKRITLDAMSSSSMKKQVATRFMAESKKGEQILFRIKGKTGVDISAIPSRVWGKEYEVILKKGATYDIGAIQRMDYMTPSGFRSYYQVDLKEVILP